jgi:hypothetical protein
MAFVLILAPFATFATLMMVASSAVSVFAAAALALGIVAWDISRGGSLKLLAAGSVLLFTALGCHITLIDGNWSPVAVRIAVDGGVLAIALVSLAIRLPFTLQYARETADAEVIRRPGFVTANYILTCVWIAAFVLMLVADMLMIYLPGLPLWVGFAVAFAARNSAVYFTKWYPRYRRAKYAAISSTQDS